VTTAHKNSILSLPIQALTLYDPNTTNDKGKGGVQAATSKSNPVQGVFAVNKDAKGHLRAKFVPVTTGITGATDIEVVAGLNEGQQIVTGPYKTLRALKDGSLLKEDTRKIELNSSGS
jgi:HlyD family secretion protein